MINNVREENMERRFGSGPRRDSGGFNRGFRPREMHKAVCSDCGQDCEVPFKPSTDAEGKPRPVYCKNCYPKHKKF